MYKFPEITEKNGPTTQAAIDEFQSFSGLRLPIVYAQFLLATNGGRPQQCLFPIEDGPHGPRAGIVDFLGFDAPFQFSDLRRTFEFHDGQFPDGVFVIANTDGPPMVVMDLRKTPKGQIWYFDNTHMWNTAEWREHDLYRVADSFEDFLGVLKAR